MSSLSRLFRRTRKNERGQGMVEYALIIGLIAVVLIGALSIMGHMLGWWGYFKVAGDLESAVTGTEVDPIPDDWKQWYAQNMVEDVPYDVVVQNPDTYLTANPYLLWKHPEWLDDHPDWEKYLDLIE